MVQSAVEPTSPSSPHPGRNTVLGAIVGFALALLFAFSRDSLDRRLRSSHDAHQALGMPILGQVRDSAMGHPGLAGKDNVRVSDADFEAFRVLRMNLGYLAADGPLRTLLVTSGLAQEGKSTVSMSLACASALAGQRTLLVECDLRRPTFAERLGIASTPGLTDFLQGKASPQDVLQVIDLPGGASSNGASEGNGEQSRLVAVTAGTRVENPAELLIGDRFKGFLEKVSKAYDLVILDTSPMLAVVDPLEIVPLVDAVLLCVRSQQTTREQARAARGALANLPARPIGAVIDRPRPQRRRGLRLLLLVLRPRARGERGSDDGGLRDAEPDQQPARQRSRALAVQARVEEEQHRGQGSGTARRERGLRTATKPDRRPAQPEQQHHSDAANSTMIRKPCSEARPSGTSCPGTG